MSEQPAYYAIIPASVRYADINPNAKLLFGELTALTSKEGFCWASNSYFAKLYGVESNTISLWINQLKDHGFITTFVDREGGNKRKIWLTYHEKSGEGITKKQDTYHEKAEHINTSIITANTSEPKGSPFTVVLEEEEKRKTPPKYPNAPAVLKLFSIIGNVPANWKINTAQLKACENLYRERGLEKIESALEFYSETRNQEYCPQITTPFDLDSKWTKLGQFKLKQ